MSKSNEARFGLGLEEKNKIYPVTDSINYKDH